MNTRARGMLGLSISALGTTNDWHVQQRAPKDAVRALHLRWACVQTKQEMA